MTNIETASDASKPDQERIKKLYGMPSALKRFQIGNQRKQFFDSGDFALNKAGKNNDIDAAVVGREHPTPENIRHLSSPSNAATQGLGATGTLASGTHNHHYHGTISVGSPVKESSSLHRQTSADDVVPNNEQAAAAFEKDTMPIRQ